MKLDQVAVQTYTIREFLTTPEDYEESLHKIAEIGYRSVQISGPRPVEEKQIAAWCAEKGLVINSTHEEPEMILESPQDVVKNLDALGCKYTAYPFPKDVDFSSGEAVSTFIRKLNEAGRVLSEAGKGLTYHNHAHEFRKIDGDIILEKIYRETDPKYLQAELDTYWVQVGGGDPALWSSRMKNRLPLLHLKDYMITEENVPTYSEIGNGVLDFKKIISEAEASGCQWFIVEQDRCPKDPFESLEISFRYIRDELLD